jgi:hypothetical protein
MPRKYLKSWGIALTAISFSCSVLSANAETLLDIYELALENDAPL